MFDSLCSAIKLRILVTWDLFLTIPGGNIKPAPDGTASSERVIVVSSHIAYNPIYL